MLQYLFIMILAHRTLKNYLQMLMVCDLNDDKRQRNLLISRIFPSNYCTLTWLLYALLSSSSTYKKSVRNEQLLVVFKFFSWRKIFFFTTRNIYFHDKKYFSSW